MGNLNPEIEVQLSKLAEHCSQCLLGETSLVDEQLEPLLRSLLMSGFMRLRETSLSVEIENRVKTTYPEKFLSRGGELAVITYKLQDKLKRMATWESTQPTEFTASRPANISSATDA